MYQLTAHTTGCDPQIIPLNCKHDKDGIQAALRQVTYLANSQTYIDTPASCGIRTSFRVFDDGRLVCDMTI